MLSHSRARREALACCPACAASVRPKRPLEVLRDGHGRRAWVGLVGAVAALVPLAAMDETGGSGIAAAASGGPEPTRQPPATPPVAVSEEEFLDLDIEWTDGVAHGTPNAGWLEGGVRLPIRGEGFYTYNPRTGRPPGGLDRRYGTAVLVRNLLDLAEWWAEAYPEKPRLGIGDLSREAGGPFRDAHLSHQNGLDVDVRLPRRDGVEGPANPGIYDRELTQAVVDRAFAQGAELVLVGPSLDISGPVTTWPNHDDHLHIRWPDPDGLGN